MRKILFLALLFVCTIVRAVTYTTTADPGVWDLGAEPGTTPSNTDDIVVNHDWSGFDWLATSARGNYQGTLTINTGGKLRSTQGWSNNTGTWIINAGGEFDIIGDNQWDVTGSITVNGTISITGDLINNDNVAGSGFVNYTTLNVASTGTFEGTITLPVELSKFNVQSDGDLVEVSWQTLSEVNNDNFEVQKSFDGITFETVGIVEGRGNSFVENNYLFVDDLSSTETVFYRLKQNDFDGAYEYSHIVVLGGVNPQVSISQFGAVNEFFVLTDQNNLVYDVQVFTVNGSLVFQTQIISQKGGRSNFQLPPYSGLFIVNVSGITASVSEKIYVK